MRKLAYLFVMIAGMTLASMSVNAQDVKKSSTANNKEVTAACCKGGEKMASSTCSEKKTASTCTKKEAGTTCQKMNDKTGACCKTKTETAKVTEKSAKTVK